ncbi:MAG: HAD family hydrolase [bacterium]
MIHSAIISEKLIRRQTFKAVVFDLDDTLYPEQQYVMSGFLAVTRYIKAVYGLDIYDDLFSLYMAGERTNVFGSALRKRFATVNDGIIRNVAHIFWAHKPQLSLFPDARTAISILSQRGIHTAAITVGQSGIQRLKVQALELEPLLDSVVHTDELLGVIEPAQTCYDAFAITALQLDVELGDILYVGDNPLSDFLVPNQLGIATVRVLRRNGEHSAASPPSAAYAPDITLTTLEMLTEILDPQIWTEAKGNQTHDTTV